MSELDPRRRVAVRVAAGAIVAAVTGTVAAALFGDIAFEPRSVGATAFSRSALGHRGFLDWLGEQGNPAVVLRSRASHDTVGSSPLFVLEPYAASAAARLRVTRLAKRKEPTLLVAPRRYGAADPDRPDWVTAPREFLGERVEEILDLSGIPARVVRPSEGVFELPSGDTIRIASPQLVVSSAIEPVVANDDGVLVGYVRGRRSFYVLSDPDVVANHGIDEPENRALLAELLGRVAKPGTPVAIDETVHGATFERDLWREALRPPLLPLTLSALLTTVLAVLAARRFLDPRRDAVAFGAGKRTLIENVASFHLEAGRVHDTGRRYRVMVEAEVAAALRVPESLSSEARRAELLRRAAARGRPFDLDGWESTFTARDALASIQRLKRWRDEVMSGAS